MRKRNFVKREGQILSVETASFVSPRIFLSYRAAAVPHFILSRQVCHCQRTVVMQRDKDVT